MPQTVLQASAQSAAQSQPFVHRSVLAREAPQEVLTRTDGIYVDATFGRGGHTRTLLSLLGQGARVFAFDRDEEAVAAAQAISDSRFEIIHAPFSHMVSELAQRGVTAVDGILMDIGVSSPQIDDASRGFSFRLDGPLDMRMDAASGISAAQWLASASEGDIERVLRVYGEERHARQIARAICARRTTQPFARTADLADFIARTIGRSHKDAGQHPATRTFQAIRIEINGFHSLEDRIVKRFFEEGAHPERLIDARIALRTQDLPEPFWQDVRRIKPTKEECEENPRSRSAVMRSAVRTARKWMQAEGGAK